MKRFPIIKIGQFFIKKALFKHVKKLMRQEMSNYIYSYFGCPSTLAERKKTRRKVNTERRTDRQKYFFYSSAKNYFSKAFAKQKIFIFNHKNKKNINYTQSNKIINTIFSSYHCWHKQFCKISNNKPDKESIQLSFWLKIMPSSFNRIRISRQETKEQSMLLYSRIPFVWERNIFINKIKNISKLQKLALTDSLFISTKSNQKSKNISNATPKDNEIPWSNNSVFSKKIKIHFKKKNYTVINTKKKVFYNSSSTTFTKNKTTESDNKKKNSFFLPGLITPLSPEKAEMYFSAKPAEQEKRFQPYNQNYSSKKNEKNK